jgi:hypothetical protein
MAIDNAATIALFCEEESAGWQGTSRQFVISAAVEWQDIVATSSSKLPA